jgi:hypothetical protein
LTLREPGHPPRTLIGFNRVPSSRRHPSIGGMEDIYRMDWRGGRQGFGGRRGNWEYNEFIPTGLKSTKCDWVDFKSRKQSENEGKSPSPSSEEITSAVFCVRVPHLSRWSSPIVQPHSPCLLC